MVKIRLSRTGRKNLASYRVVVVNDREKRETNFIEILGFYLPSEKKIEINEERAKYWLSVGAQPTETARYLLFKKNLVEAPTYKRVFKKTAGKKATERRAKKAEAAAAKEETKAETTTEAAA